MFEIYKGKKVLVTGDTGFKGSWLVLWLNYLGAKVSGYGLSPRTEKDNYVICGLDSEVKHVQGDIRNFELLDTTVQHFRPDFIFHLAAQPLVLESYTDPRGTFEANIMGTVNVLEACRRCDSVKSIVIVTTDKCYENKEWIYGYRENDPLGGHDPYSASKAGAEIVAHAYSSSFFTKNSTASIATCRAGNVIGGGDWSPNRIIPDCMRSLKNGLPITIRNPNAIRPWQHVLEPLAGYLTLGEKLYDDENYRGAWNFGPLQNGIASVEKLVATVVQSYGSGTYVVENGENAPHEASLLQLDISKAIHKLPWQPRLDFKTSVEWTVQEYLTDEKRAREQCISHIKQYMSVS